MAQLLVRIADRTHTDPEVSGRQYTRGDIVDIFPDGQLTMPQSNPNWAVIQVTGLDVDAAKARLLAYDYDPPVGDQPKVLARRRLRTISWADLPAGVQATILADRHYTTTLVVLKEYIKNKRTGDLGDAA